MIDRFHSNSSCTQILVAQHIETAAGLVSLSPYVYRRLTLKTARLFVRDSTDSSGRQLLFVRDGLKVLVLPQRFSDNWYFKNI